MCLVLDEHQRQAFRRAYLEHKLAEQVDQIVDDLMAHLIDRAALQHAVAEIERIERDTVTQELTPASQTAPTNFAGDGAGDGSATVVVDGKRYPIVIGVDA